MELLDLRVPRGLLVSAFGESGMRLSAATFHFLGGPETAVALLASPTSDDGQVFRDGGRSQEAKPRGRLSGGRMHKNGLVESMKNTPQSLWSRFRRRVQKML